MGMTTSTVPGACDSSSSFMLILQPVKSWRPIGWDAEIYCTEVSVQEMRKWSSE